MRKYVENIVVGDGIMAKQLIFELQKTFSDIICISSVDFAPPCSLSSTALNCIRGAEKGVSKLGDLIFDAQLSFESFYNEYKPAGVVKTKEVQTWVENGPTHAKWLRRYKVYDAKSLLRFKKVPLKSKLAVVEVDAYVLDTNLLFDWYASKSPSLKRISDFVVHIEKQDLLYKISCKSGNIFICKNLFLCTSYMSGKFLSLCKEERFKKELKKHKKVYGNYLHCSIDKDVDYGLDLSKSFSLSYNFLRLIYREGSNELLLSINDYNKEAFTLDSKCLESMFLEFINVLELKELPHFNMWSLVTGIRSKGERRVPFCEQVDDSLFICTGLYKNAFSFSYFFSKKITDLLI